MTLVLTLVPAGIIFAILLISLGFSPKFMNRLLGIIFLFVGVCGIILYGYGFYQLLGSGPVSILRTVFAVFCMFLGRNEIGTISAVPELKTPLMQILIYLMHMIALYATASAVVTNIGARLIRSLNLLFLHHQRINLIYGVNDASMAFAGKLQNGRHAVTVFIDNGSGQGLENKILQMGSIMFAEQTDQVSKPAFLRKIGMKPGNKELRVFCLDERGDKNLQFAENLKTALQEAGIRAAQTRLTILQEDETIGSVLQASTAGDDGFGSVMALERQSMIARMLVRTYPPCRTMRFREKGEADENFEALIVGFGKTGQAVLRSLVMNGQFEGSRFHAAVIARDYTQAAGAFFNRYQGIADSYAIDFMEENARSLKAFEYLTAHVEDLNYVVICTGNEEENAEIAREYKEFLKDRGSKAQVLQCSSRGITSFTGEEGLLETVDPFVPEILDGTQLDAMAKIINHKYNEGQGRTLEEDWAACDYFSRMSCRASADFIEAFLAATGCSEEEVMQNGWPADPVLMENLARMEHLRWCAFHYAMGYQPMPEAIFRERAADPSIRAGKDTIRKLHACLRPWEDLPTLQQMETELTGRSVDYHQMDLNNVLMIPAMLKERNAVQ